MSTSHISWLLFDADNTLLDFTQASKDALWATFAQNERFCDEAIYQTYQRVNNRVWEAFEKGKIDAATLRYQRFELLFEAIKESHLSPQDFNRQYLQNLIHTSEAYEGVWELMQSLKKEYRLSIVTNGLKEVQRPRLEKLDMTHFFDSIVVSDEIGVAKPHLEYFKYVYDSIDNPPDKSELMIIGDSLRSDILGGNDFGIKTCWISHGKENTTKIQPDFEIHHIGHLPNVLP